MEAEGSTLEESGENLPKNTLDKMKEDEELPDSGVGLEEFHKRDKGAYDQISFVFKPSLKGEMPSTSCIEPMLLPKK
jgi:hypothetical protein